MIPEDLRNSAELEEARPKKQQQKCVVQDSIFTPVISAFWDAEAGESQSQEIETILANTVKPHLY